MEYNCPSWVTQKRGFQRGVAHAVDTIFLDDARQTRGYKQHRETVILPNLNMIFDTCQQIDLSAEDYVWKKLERMDYKIIDCRQYGEGHPDYIVIKGNTRVYVEVKSTNDGLRMEQAKWIFKHPEKQVVIYWVNNVK